MFKTVLIQNFMEAKMKKLIIISLITLIPILSIGMLVYSFIFEIQQKDLLLKSKVELIEALQLEIEAKDEQIKAQQELIEILKKK